MRRSASSGAIGARDAGFARQAGALRRFDDQGGEAFAAPPVKTVGLRVFVDQAFELARVAGKSAVDERRRQVADGQRRRCGVWPARPRPDC